MWQTFFNYKNKEDVIDEKILSLKEMLKIDVYYSEVIYPDYKRYTRDEYVQHISV
jgi:hypothetical protein